MFSGVPNSAEVPGGVVGVAARHDNLAGFHVGRMVGVQEAKVRQGEKRLEKDSNYVTANDYVCRAWTYRNVCIVHDISAPETVGLVGEDVVHDCMLPNCLGDRGAVLTSLLADVLRLVSCIEDIGDVLELNAQHGVRGSQER